MEFKKKTQQFKKNNYHSLYDLVVLIRIFPAKTSNLCVSIFTATITFDVKPFITIILLTTHEPLLNQCGIQYDEVNRKILKLQLLAVFSTVFSRIDKVLSNGIVSAFQRFQLGHCTPTSSL